MRITLLDYGAGNLHSLTKALAGVGRQVCTTTDLATALEADLLVLPGVGAFTPAARALAPARIAMRNAIRDGLPTLGICLGMQLLFESSEEGAGEGLGVLDGRVTRLVAECVPQMGWNVVEGNADPLFGAAGIREAYYANGFACRPSDPDIVIAWTTHEGDRMPAAVRAGRCVGVQFHPEKSSARGLQFLDRVVRQLVDEDPQPQDGVR